MNEGRIWGKVDQPYEISYRIITPKIKECKNLLVPVAVSASHVAFCSIRVEVIWMQLGQAVGIAAAITAQKKIPVQGINIRYLQNQLKAVGIIISIDHQKWKTNDVK